MTNDLRQRRKEDQSSKLIDNTSKHSKRTYGYYVIRFGVPVLLCAFLIPVLVNRLNSFLIYDDASDDQYYPSEILYLFQKHDRDGDHYLSIDEFEPIAYQLTQKKLPTDYVQPILNNDHLITINAFFEPLNISTMTKEIRYKYMVTLFFIFYFL